MKPYRNPKWKPKPQMKPKGNPLERLEIVKRNPGKKPWDETLKKT